MEKGIRTRTLLWIASVWSALVAVVLIWQTVEYRGIVGWLAELQFRILDRFFPVATIAVLTMLLSLPLAITVFLRLKRSIALGGADSNQRVAERASLVSRSFHFAIIATALIAVALFALGLAQGGLADKPVEISLADLQSPDAGRTIPDGSVRVRGEVLLDRLGFYDDGFLFMSRELWVAPMVTGFGSEPITTFVQVRRGQYGPRKALRIEGRLKKSSVPGGLAQLFRNAGYVVAQKPNLIYADLRSIRWPYWSAAADFAILLLLLSALALLHRRYVKKLAS